MSRELRCYLEAGIQVLREENFLISFGEVYIGVSPGPSRKIKKPEVYSSLNGKTLINPQRLP